MSTRVLLNSAKLARRKQKPLLQLLACFFLLIVGTRYPSSSSGVPIRREFTAEELEAEKKKIGNTVIVTAVNYAFRSHLSNFRCSLRKLGIADQLRVVALDPLAESWAKNAEYNVLESTELGGNFTTTGHAQFGSEDFNLLSKRKIGVVARELAAGNNVLFTDADMFWCQNAVDQVLKIAAETPEADLLMQTAWPRSLLNSGFYFARAGPKTDELFKELLKHAGPKENDQVIFNRVLCERKHGGGVWNREEDKHIHRKLRHPYGCRRGKTFAAVLDRLKYPTGGELIDGEKIFHYGRKKLNSMCSCGEFVVIHNNCILSDRKTARFIVKGFWYVSEDESTCLTDPAPMTHEALKRCGIPKCGSEDLEEFMLIRKKMKEISNNKGLSV